ncbi:MAG: SurA N-terminal domain-containing protein [Gammaproteobacteria bacterium]|jgi:peptidyl-prolyl cis-trans isomerase D
MLQSIRDHISGWIAWAIILLLSVPFALWGINQYFSASAPDYVAKVNGQEISIQNYRQAYQNQYQRLEQMFGNNFNPDMIDEKGLHKQVLEQLINRELLRQKISAEKYRVGADKLTDAIQSLPAFQINGKFSLDVYRTRLPQMGLTAAGFEQSYRQSLEMQELQNGITRSAFATDTGVNEQVALEKEQRKVGYLTVPEKAFEGQIKLTDDDIQAYYKAHQDKYMTTETVSLAYLELNSKTLADNIQLTDTELKDYYNQNKQQFMTPKRVRAEHILIAPQGDGKDADDKARAQAEDILKQLDKGADFATLAKKYSADPQSAKKGGDLGWVEKGTLVAPVEKALFDMKKGQVQGPVKSQFGYHILKVTDIDEPDIKSFDQVKDQIAADLKKKKVEDKFYDVGEQLADLTYSNPDSLSKAANTLGLEIKTVTGVSHDNGTGIASSDKVREAAFSDAVLNQGLNSDPIELGDQHVVVIRVKSHQPSEPKPLEDVRSDIVTALTVQKATRLAADKARSLADAIASGKSLQEAVDAGYIEVHEATFVPREGNHLPSQLNRAIFDAPRPRADKPVVDTVALQSGDSAVFRLEAVKAGDPSSLDKKDRDNRLRQLARQHGNSEFQAYIKDLRSRAEIEIREQALSNE